MTVSVGLIGARRLSSAFTPCELPVFTNRRAVSVCYEIFRAVRCVAQVRTFPFIANLSTFTSLWVLLSFLSENLKTKKNKTGDLVSPFPLQHVLILFRKKS